MSRMLARHWLEHHHDGVVHRSVRVQLTIVSGGSSHLLHAFPYAERTLVQSSLGAALN